MDRKGFTLIELLIVIAIIGILAAAVVVVLNPAELLAQARDGTRLSDVDAVQAAISLYLADTDTPDVTEGVSGDVARAMGTTVCGFSIACVATSSTATDGTGWVSVDLDSISGGSPLPVLPTDPTNDATDYYYAFAADESENTFEINARLESTRHRDKMLNDGGEDSTCPTFTTSTCWYEKGTDPGLNLFN